MSDPCAECREDLDKMRHEAGKLVAEWATKAHDANNEIGGLYLAIDAIAEVLTGHVWKTNDVGDARTLATILAIVSECRRARREGDIP